MEGLLNRGCIIFPFFCLRVFLILLEVWKITSELDRILFLMSWCKVIRLDWLCSRFLEFRFQIYLLFLFFGLLMILDNLQFGNSCLGSFFHCSLRGGLVRILGNLFLFLALSFFVFFHSISFLVFLFRMEL